jgi:DNA-binding transcriptional regulator LsrR (DeoR family)
MPQTSSFAITNDAGAAVRARINEVIAALHSTSAGASAPTAAVAGMLWVDTSASPPVLRRRNATNTGWDALLDAAGNLAGLANTALARGNLGLGTMATKAAVEYDATIASKAALTGATFTGVVTAPNFVSSSDARLKSDIMIIPDALALVCALRDRYGLTEAIVIDCSEDRDGAVMARIGEAAAHFLEVTLRQDEVIGVSSWSQTILRMVDNIHPMRAAKAKYIVQILGGMGQASVQAHATQLTANLAKLTGGEPRLLLVQGITSSREAKLVMLSDPSVRGTMDHFGRLTLAIVGIGAVEPSELLARSGNVFSPEELAMLNDAGAVGEISFRFYDKDGKPVETPLNDRVIGITLDELRKADRVMALGGGVSKTAAIAGALRLGIIDVLVTDKFTAARLTA